MELTIWDGLCFFAFLGLVIGVSLYASRKEESSEDYFLAGRNLSWGLIGFSLIASNISTEHFVGMAGAGFGEAGLAIASYEWIAAVALVIVGLFLLPLYLRLGIYTMPEYLEHRYGAPARTLMAIYMMTAYVGVAMAAVLYSGALGLRAVFGMDLYAGIWLIGIFAGAYTIYGGLKAVVWSDLLQGTALLLGGLTVALIGLSRVGGLGEFLARNSGKLHMSLPAGHSEIPWTALLLGIWIPNFFYWGCNQFITQRTLGSRSLRDGQMGIMLAASIKLMIPFIIVFPGIMALQLYGDQIVNGDEAYPILIKNLLPAGLRGILFAALFGAVMSSLDSMLNSAASIFTMDLYRRHLRPDAGSRQLVRVGRLATAVFVLAACALAPLPGEFEGVFRYIQMFWGFISPGVVAAFLFGMLFRRAPLQAAMSAMLLGIPVYGTLLWLLPGTAFLNHMAVTFLVLVGVMGLWTTLKPLPEPVRMTAKSRLNLTPSRPARILGALIIAAVVLLYILFW